MYLCVRGTSAKPGKVSGRVFVCKVLLRYKCQAWKVSDHVFVCKVLLRYKCQARKVSGRVYVCKVLLRYKYQARNVSGHVFVCKGCRFCRCFYKIFGTVPTVRYFNFILLSHSTPSAHGRCFINSCIYEWY